MAARPISTTHHIGACIRLFQNRWCTFVCREISVIHDMEHGTPPSAQGAADVWDAESDVGATPLLILQGGIPDTMDVHRRTMDTSNCTGPRHDATPVVVELNGYDADPEIMKTPGGTRSTQNKRNLEQDITAGSAAMGALRRKRGPPPGSKKKLMVSDEGGTYPR